MYVYICVCVLLPNLCRLRFSVLSFRNIWAPLPHLEIGEEVHSYLLDTQIHQLHTDDHATCELQTLKLIDVPVNCQDVLCQFLVIPHYASHTEYWLYTLYGWLLAQNLAFLASQKHIHDKLTDESNEQICALAEWLIPYPLRCDLSSKNPDPLPK